MGACGSEESRKTTQTKIIDESLKRHAKTLSTQVKVLLLGPGESGKSTVFKQMKILQDDGGFSEQEKLSFKENIYNNCISQMRTMIEACISVKQVLMNKQSIEYAQQIMRITRDMTWNKELGEMIKHLWSDPGIQQIYQKRGKLYQLNDTTQYFMEHIDRINSSNYVPTQEDVLRVRVQSTGIEEAEFTFDKHCFRVIDVGGQRSERRKWIHCFEGVTAVLYCTSLIDYYLPLREDPRQNRLVESLMLFGEIIHQDTFKNKYIIIFLNKTDLLEEKLLHYPLEEYQAEYKAPSSEDPKEHFQTASEFIKDLFLMQVDENRRKLATLYFHKTCALDTHSIEIVISAVRTKLLQEIFETVFVDI